MLATSRVVAEVVTALGIAALGMACTSGPLRVGIVFENGWNLRNEPLTEPEQTLVKNAALQTLRAAFHGFGVECEESRSGDRLIRVEDTPYGHYRPGSIVFPFPPVGTTFPIAKVSSVRIDALYALELATVHCRASRDCRAKTRQQLLEGLGRGVGATAAHELGHQMGLHFSGDVKCDDCYDGHSADTSVHFWGAKHWSEHAVAVMRRVLPMSRSG